MEGLWGLGEILDREEILEMKWLTLKPAMSDRGTGFLQHIFRDFDPEPSVEGGEENAHGKRS